MRFEEIAEFVLRPQPMSDDLLSRAALLLVDTLGVAAGATDMAPGVMARNHAFRFHGASAPGDAATMLFDGRMASIPGAAFAAATQIDNLDAHDGYNPSKGHIGCAVVPALCAFGQHHPDLTGRDALAVLAMSYEVSARAAIALHNTVSDYHTSGAWNALGVVAVGARLGQVTQEVLRHAFGIAEYHGPRSQMMREIANPTMLHDGSGMGALVGAIAVLVAQDGFEGAPAITVEDDEVAQYWNDLGSAWTIMDNYIKPYPICRWAHAAIDALGQVMEAHTVAAEQIERIEVRTFAQAAALYPAMPETTSQAQYSLPFALAVRLVHGEIGPKNIAGAGLSDAQVAKAIEKIVVHEEERHSKRFPQGRWSDITVHTLDGRVFASGDVHARGGPEAPMQTREIERKFHTMAANLPEHRRTALWDIQGALVNDDAKFSDLLALIHPSIGAANA